MYYGIKYIFEVVLRICDTRLKIACRVNFVDGNRQVALFTTNISFKVFI